MRVTNEARALAWLRVGRTSAQLAEVCGWSHNYAAVLCRRLYQRGLLRRERVDPVAYRYQAVAR